MLNRLRGVAAALCALAIGVVIAASPAFAGEAWLSEWWRRGRD